MFIVLSTSRVKFALSSSPSLQPHLSPGRAPAHRSAANIRVSRAVVIAGCSLLGMALNVTSRAENPESAGGLRVSQNDTESKHVNLKVLPSGISDANLILLMVRYGQDLGVQCAFCHVENPQTRQVDFLSDENPMKQTARIMIGMLSDINTKYLAKVGDRRYAVPLTCGNCHQGQTYPPTFESKSSP
jgi:hypothetical protein